jgi:hypothetical protein
MKSIRFLVFTALTILLAACGGGGGSAGVASGGAGSGTSAAAATMGLTLVDSAGTAIATHILSQTQPQFLKVVLKDSSGANVPYTRVTVTLDSTLAVLLPVSGTQLTDASGVVLMRIAPANVRASGTVLATASASVSTTALTKTYDLQINAGTVSLSAVSASPLSVQKGQSVNVAVNVTVNGAPAASNSVTVNFSSACGTVTPSSALVDSTGNAVAVVQTNTTGSCTVDAAVNGVTTAPTSYTVTASPITGIQFVSAAPNLLYQSGSAGVSTSVVTFKVVDSVAAGVQGVTVNATLTNTDGGLNFCGSTSSGSSSGISSPDGTVTFSVCAGTLPATVQVRVELAGTASVFTNSNLLTVQTGIPTQRFFDISASQLNFFAGGYFTSKFNGNTVSLSVFSADRQGNPVPDGTKIIFVSEGGQINSSGLSSCLLVSGRCSVNLIGQDYRPMGSAAAGGDPRPGRVTVLAYTDGEEYFVDANNNNRWDTGELFEDLGSLYLDKDESASFAAAYTNLVTGTNEGEVTYPLPSGAVGGALCPTNSNIGLSVASTCNGVWDGATKVRRSIVIVFSGDEIGQPGSYDATIPVAKRTQTISRTISEIVVQLADFDGNPLPATAGIAATVTVAGTTCAVTLVGTVIGNSTEPTTHTATLDKCVAGDVVSFKVTAGTKISSYSVTVP